MKYKLLSLCMFVFAFASMNAQTIYTCDFEDDAENQKWKLNVTANPSIQFANKWYIDKAINNGGEKSLYISKDGGLTPGYSSGSRMISTRDTLILDPGDYELSFDWLAGGAGGIDALFVAWIPEDDSVPTNSAPNGVKPEFVNVYGLVSDPSIPIGADSLRSPSWQTSVFSIENHDGTPHKLVFVWVNSTNSSSVKGACIDNILIAPKGLCDAPADLSFTTSGSSVTLSWSGNAPEYDVRCYSKSTGRWVNYNNVTSNSVTMYNVQEGVYDFYVRSVCNAFKSHWVSKRELVYLPDERCIDYLTLTNANCWIGSPGNGGRGNRQKVDFGSNSKESRHTLHMTEGEFDPRTGNKLPTIPLGELASVRLGNWKTGNEAECIEYTYTVDAAKAAVLLLKYAVVLEDPNHNESEQPRFELKVLHKNRVVDCANAVFRAGFDTGDKTWHIESGICWKEWTTIGVNLADYDGETLTIRISSYDCTLGGHYGYAYFTLGCSDGKMDGIACGDTPTTEFIAPAGFKYSWYLPDNPSNILSTNQIFNVNPMDTLTYHCDIIFPEDVNCYFTLTASAMPRYPVAEATFNISHDDCKNVVTFNNTSHIMTKNQITADSTHTVSACEWIEWDFGDGKLSHEYNPVYEFPLEGGSYTVKLRAGISTCADEKEFTIDLPRLGTTYDTIAAFGCLGTSYTLPSGNTVWGDGLYPNVLTSIYGCDSIVVYDLKFMTAITVEVSKTICSDESYYFDGRDLVSSGTYTERGLSMYGCDSTTILHLTVIEAVQVELDATDIAVCSDESSVALAYRVLSGNVHLYSLEFTEPGRAAGFENMGGIVQNPIILPLSPSVLPGTYPASLIFFDENCGNDTIQINLNLRYTSAIITQRWDDVLGILNSTYNGGYDFSAYQWYRNGELLFGETKPYLYVSGGLNTSDLYSAELTRLNDGVSAFTCGFIPEAGSAELILVSNTVQALSRYPIESNSEGMARIYSLTGSLISEHPIQTGSTYLPAPSESGYYLLQLTTASGTRVYHLRVTP